MRYIKEFRDSELAKKMIDDISCKSQQDMTIMEVCGTHTMRILENGIRDLLPQNINLISGPGCPICVTPQGYVDTAINLCKKHNVIITTFADMLKVPGTYSSLSIEKSLGRDIRVVMSPIDSIKIAKENLEKEIVFLGIGFETTAPIIALSIDKAKTENINNFSVLNGVKTMPNAIKNIVLDNKVNIDGFLCPGNVSAIIGVKPFEFLPKEFNLSAVIAGFEYCDIIAAIYFLVQMINSKKYEVKNIYNRIVRYEGNKKALSIIDKVFIPAYGIWRGFGTIEDTSLALKEEYKRYDAEFKLGIKIEQSDVVKDCLCGEVLKGIKKPINCNMFSIVCTPSNPLGPCMISHEGSCGLYYKYRMK